jgi:hypothetical protein
MVSKFHNSFKGGNVPTPIWKEKAEDLNVKADAQADSFLDKLKGSKWTGAILMAGAAIVIVILLSLF